MANIKNAKKRIKTTKTKTERNKIVKSKVKMFEHKIAELIKNGNKAEATKILSEATKAIDMAASKGIYHKNNAGRKISRLQKTINKV